MEKHQYVFIAGGMGITPFRSMTKYMLDTRQPSSVLLLYTAEKPEDFLFRELFDKAEKELNFKTVYIVTQTEGYINKETIKKYLPDLSGQYFYISGPQKMVMKYSELLKTMQVDDAHIKTDLFTGYDEV